MDKLDNFFDDSIRIKSMSNVNCCVVLDNYKWMVLSDVPMR